MLISVSSPAKIQLIVYNNINIYYSLFTNIHCVYTWRCPPVTDRTGGDICYVTMCMNATLS